jgi:ribosomal protein S27AE
VTEKRPPVVGFCPKCGSGTMRRHGKKDDGARQRYSCRECNYRTTQPMPEPREETAVEFITSLPEAGAYFFTAAQNATPVHAAFWKNLLVYCEAFGATPVVSGYRYRNPTSVWSDRQSDDEWWAPEVVPYLYQTRAAVNQNLQFLGDIFTQATAVRPLTGFESVAGESSCILPHAKIQVRTVPTPAHKYPKIMMTTGACTVPNYTKTKAGALGEFHHSIAGVVVRVSKDGRFSAQHVVAQKNGSFYDLTRDGVVKVENGKITTGHKLAGLVKGDTHVDYVDPGVVAATYENDDSIASVGDPNWFVWHDLIDLASRNRYANDPFIEVAKRRSGADSVYDELCRGWKFHDEMARKKKSAIVPSNHTNSRLQWYMRETDWRSDPTNAEFYFETGLQMLRSLRNEPAGPAYDDPFTYWGKKLSKAPNVRFLERDESFRIAGIECQYHGDVGPGAARGASLENMRRIGPKVIFCHTHTPGTEEGAMTGGTSTRLRLGYNVGPNGWMNSHVGIYPNGKRAHLFIMDGAWTY